MGEAEKIGIQPSFDTLEKLTKVANGALGTPKIKTIFEFGSRYGEDSIAFAKKYPRATIFAFECNPNTLPDCRKNIIDFKNIILTEKAVSNIDGPISFFKIDSDKTETTWLDGNQGASSILKASGKYPIEKYVQEEIKVECTRLSTFIEERKINYIDILWMDIQGAELSALEGLNRKITCVKIIHLEVEFFEIYKEQPMFVDINRFLTENNFELLGFTYLGEFAGDAIYVNKQFVSAKRIKHLKKILSRDPQINFLQRIKYFYLKCLRWSLKQGH